MENPTTQYYVKVNAPDGGEYYVGPFEDAGDSFSYGSAAIDWLYRQIGLLKTAYPDAKLVKHKWRYQEKAHGFDRPVVEVSVEIADFFFEIRELRAPSFTNVIQEVIESKSTEDQF